MTSPMIQSTEEAPHMHPRRGYRFSVSVYTHFNVDGNRDFCQK